MLSRLVVEACDDVRAYRTLVLEIHPVLSRFATRLAPRDREARRDLLQEMWSACTVEACRVACERAEVRGLAPHACLVDSLWQIGRRCAAKLRSGGLVRGGASVRAGSMARRLERLTYLAKAQGIELSDQAKCSILGVGRVALSSLEAPIRFAEFDVERASPRHLDIEDWLDSIRRLRGAKALLERGTRRAIAEARSIVGKTAVDTLLAGVDDRADDARA